MSSHLDEPSYFGAKSDNGSQPVLRVSLSRVATRSCEGTEGSGWVAFITTSLTITYTEPMQIPTRLTVSATRSEGGLNG
jgi:hypothetical protein